MIFDVEFLGEGGGREREREGEEIRREGRGGQDLRRRVE